MREPDHTCIICGKRYHSCDTCEKIKTYTPWRTICDEFHCYSIYLAIRSYQVGFTTKEEAREELDSLGVKSHADYANWTAGTKKCLDEIFSAPQKKKAYKREESLKAAEETTE
ncbi:hypothetical protein AALA22_08850 [Anaerovoracaceae bacterium 41-7]